MRYDKEVEVNEGPDMKEEMMAARPVAQAKVALDRSHRPTAEPAPRSRAEQSSAAAPGHRAPVLPSPAPPSAGRRTRGRGRGRGGARATMGPRRGGLAVGRPGGGGGLTARAAL